MEARKMIKKAWEATTSDNIKVPDLEPVLKKVTRSYDRFARHYKHLMKNRKNKKEED